MIQWNLVKLLKSVEHLKKFKFHYTSILCKSVGLSIHTQLKVDEVKAFNTCIAIPQLNRVGL